MTDPNELQQALDVVPHAGDVDRNMRADEQYQLRVRRPPRGGRG